VQFPARGGSAVSSRSYSAPNSCHRRAMAGVRPPATDIRNGTFPVKPSDEQDSSLRVMFIHGGGSTDGLDRTHDPYAVYLRARFQHFTMRSVRQTSDFELVVRTHAEEAATFRPDVIVGQSQGGPTILELMHRGLWQGPSVICCPALVDGVDDHLLHLLDNVPILLVTGRLDQQVPLHRVQSLHAANSARLAGGLGLIVVEDIHSLCSLCNDAIPAAHVDGSAGIEDSGCGTLYAMVRTVWAMRERVASESGYKHEERLPASRSVEATAVLPNARRTASTAPRRKSCIVQ